MVLNSTRFSRTLFLALLVGLIFLPSHNASRGEAAESKSDKKTDQLIEQLGSDDFDQREAATRALIEREDSEPRIRTLLQSPDLEVRRRAGDILNAFERNRAKRGLDRAVSLAKEGRIDQLIERLVQWRDLDKEGKGWEALMELAEKLVDLEKRTFGKTPLSGQPSLPIGSFRRFIASASPISVSSSKPVVKETKAHLIRGEEVTIRDSR